METHEESFHTPDGINVSGDFQIAPKNSGLQRSIISVGQVCEFRSTGGTIHNLVTESNSDV